MSVTITPELLQAMSFSITNANAKLYAPILQKCMDKYGITVYPLRAASFLANAIHESMNLSRVKESFVYRSPDRLLLIFPRYFKELTDATAIWKKGGEAIANRVYANQNGNGSESSGDGFKYCGRGIGQVTGKANYAAVGKKLGIDLINHPELLEKPDNAVESFCVFWNDRQLNAVADNADFEKVCKVINGGKIGLDERKELYKSALKALNA